MMENFVENLFARAHAAGLADCQVYSMRGVELFGDSAGSEVTGEVAALNFEASLDGKTVGAYGENFDLKTVDFLVTACVENASILDNAPRRKIYAGKIVSPMTQNTSESGAADPECIRTLMHGMKAEMCASGKGAEHSHGYVQSLARTLRVINDHGLDVSAQHSHTFSVFEPICSRGDQVKTGMFFSGGAGPADVDIYKMVGAAIGRVHAYLGATQIASGAYPAVFCNEAASYLLQSMSIFFAKDLVDNGRSRFQNALGQTVASPLVTIIDDPHMKNGLFSMPFDAQGVPTRRRSMIEAGVLKNLFCDLNSAEPEKGLHPGSCTRSRYNLPAEMSASNMIIQPGGGSENELLARMGSGLYITEVSDYFPGHGLNLASGNFSLPAKGFVVKNGQLGAPFENVTASGNLYTLLQQIEGLGNEVAFGLPVNLIPGMPFRAGCYGSPALLVNTVSIAGK